MKGLWLAVLAMFLAVGIATAQEKKEEPKAAGTKTELTFEDGKVGSEWKTKGDVKVVGEQKHGGEKSLMLGAKAEATLSVAKTDSFGTATMWIWDNGCKFGTTHANGPQFGLVNEDGDKFYFSIIFAPYLKGDDTYGWQVSIEPYSKWYSRAARSAGWHRIVFTYPDAKTLTVKVDDKYDSATDPNVQSGDAAKIKFDKGFTGLWFYGGQDDKAAPLHVDDIIVEMK